MSQPQLSQVLKPISDAAVTSSGRGRQCQCQRASQCQSGGLGNARCSTQVSRTWFGEAVVERADCGQRNEHQGRCASERGRHHAMQVRASGRQQAAGCWLLAGWLAGWLSRGRIFLPARAIDCNCILPLCSLRCTVKALQCFASGTQKVLG